MKTFDGLSLAGDHGGGIDRFNTFDLNGHEVFFWYFDFISVPGGTIDSPNPKPLLTITAAGGDFW